MSEAEREQNGVKEEGESEEEREESKNRERRKERARRRSVILRIERAKRGREGTKYDMTE